MTDKIRWGIIGAGKIARRFAAGLKSVNGAELLAIASRSKESSERFGSELQIPRRYAGYEEMLRDPDIDVVYVATPHVFHEEHTLLCLGHGKAVLCEKPFAINARQARKMIGSARRGKLFLMEAMWMYFFPAMARVRELIASGAIGEVRLLKADFCFQSEIVPEGRLFNPALGGGGLLDVGVYPLALAQMVFGQEPERISTAAHIGATGVDEQAAMILGYAGGAQAVLTSSMRVSTPQEALVVGTDGCIRIPSKFSQPDRIILGAGCKEEEMNFPRLGNGYGFEATAVGECLRRGQLESEIMPLKTTLAVMRTMDRIRAKWKFKYPME